MRIKGTYGCIVCVQNIYMYKWFAYDAIKNITLQIMTNWSKFLEDFCNIQCVSVVNLQLFAPVKTEL